MPLKPYITHIHALDVVDEQLKEFVGPIVFGDSFDDAQERCIKNGKGYLFVIGEFVENLK